MAEASKTSLSINVCRYILLTGAPYIYMYLWVKLVSQMTSGLQTHVCVPDPQDK